MSKQKIIEIAVWLKENKWECSDNEDYLIYSNTLNGVVVMVKLSKLDDHVIILVDNYSIPLITNNDFDKFSIIDFDTAVQVFTKTLSIYKHYLKDTQDKKDLLFESFAIGLIQ